MPALDSAPYLKPCPFCGCELESRWNRANPSAKCATPECMGSKLPSLCLDVPEHIEAWNTRAEVAMAHANQNEALTTQSEKINTALSKSLTAFEKLPKHDGAYAECNAAVTAIHDAINSMGELGEQICPA